MDYKIDIALLRRDLGMKQAEFAYELGIKQPYLSEIENGKKPITDELYERMKQRWGINVCDKYNIVSQTSPVGNNNVAEPSMVNLVSLTVKGGRLSDYCGQACEYECERIASPVGGAELAIRVYGDSMSPEYPNGSLVYVKRVNERAFLEWGKVYVLDTCNGAVIKRLVPSERDGYVRCVSINPAPEFAPFEVSLEDVFRVFVVMACLSMR